MCSAVGAQVDEVDGRAVGVGVFKRGLLRGDCIKKRRVRFALIDRLTMIRVEVSQGFGVLVEVFGAGEKVASLSFKRSSAPG